VEIKGRAGEDLLDLSTPAGRGELEGRAELQRRLQLDHDGSGDGLALDAAADMSGQQPGSWGHLLGLGRGREQGVPGGQRGSGWPAAGRPAPRGAGGGEDQRRGGQAGDHDALAPARSMALAAVRTSDQ